MLSFFTRSIVRAFNAVVLLGIVIGLGIFTVVIGMYNYDRSMTDLTRKAGNTAELASISLTEPIWNYDAAAMEGILSAILLDADVVGIRVVKTNGEMAGEKIRDALAKTTFDELLKNPDYIETGAKINREGEAIASVQILTSTEKVKALIRYTTLLIGSFSLVFLLIIASFIWLLGKRIIQRPIDALRNSADQLASGHLDYEINTKRNDELGSLAVSFDQMRNSIRKKLADLAILNHTGETMAGIHDQTEALETVIKVMSEQSCVERGSIYLLDAEQNLTLHAYYPEMGGGASFPKSFKLSEGVAGHVASTGKTLFLPDVSKAPDYVGMSANEHSKALLCVPMMDDKTVFGVMNFVGEVGKVSFAPEDEGFALTIARMAVITTKNIQMLEVIAEQNRTLEERILLRTSELRQKTNDVSNMLQNMRQGIFTIVNGSVIHAEYSAFLTEIFETSEVANQRVSPFLFDRSSVAGDVLNQVEATLDAMIGEDAMNFQFNSHLLVTEYTKLFDGGRTKILELDWNPVLDSDELIDKLMVTVRDVTELKALQLETEKQKEQLEIIGQILSVSKDKLLEFIKSSYEFMDENQALIGSNEEKDLEVIATLFRNMHTIKGNARTYGLNYITDSVHEAETTYSRLRSEEDFPWDQTELLEQLQAARLCVARYETIFKEKLAGFTDEAGIDPAVLESISNAIDGINEMSQVNELKHSIQLIRNSINTFRYESVGETLKGIIAAVPSIAKQLDKELPEILITDNFVRLSRDIVPMLRNVFMHVFRNSLDHGLESTAQRLAQGKAAHGQINLNVSLDADQVLFSFSDDGKGLALESIQRKAIANGQLTAEQVVSDEQIAELIFLSGLSTATEVTNVSGRGVGMDAIRKFLQKHHGNVQVVFPGPPAANGFRPFALLITLPAKFALHQS
ncbi:MAG: HAMP domain-containing protein [Pseudomonadaceae bacterium]|nr:HAMP domain-containing protein [Pseudomonadaceae bacterium]